jgi:hypothetical protein
MSYLAKRARADVDARLDALHRDDDVHGRKIWALKRAVDRLEACYTSEWTPPPPRRVKVIPRSRQAEVEG